MTRVAQLSVAISTLERPDALERCLAALAGGEVLPSEVIVVDQSSNDDTRALVEKWRSSLLPITYFGRSRSAWPCHRTPPWRLPLVRLSRHRS